MSAASALGVDVIDHLPAWHRDAVTYQHSGREALVLAGRVFPGMGSLGEFCADHKQATKWALRDLGIPTPEGVVFRDPAHAARALSALLSRHPVCVCKPVDGSVGRGVGLGLTGLAEVIAHWQAHRSRFGTWLLEAQAPGEDLRMHAIGGELVAACVRRPASVTGDGVHTIAALASARDAAIQMINGANRLIIDDTSRSLLAAEGLRPGDVLAPGREVRLKRVSNLAQGGHAVDVTELLHPRYRAWIAAIAEALDLSIFAVDFTTPDPAADPADAAHLIEINARGEWLHHLFSERRTHDLPSLLLRAVLGLPHSLGSMTL